jgi:plasmid stabilization system protein ParE
VNVIVDPEAAADVAAASDWCEAQRPGLGDAFEAAFFEALDAVLRAPEAYRVVHRDVRRVLLRRFPYELYYRVFGEDLVVIACLHGRRHPARWLRRLP